MLKSLINSEKDYLKIEFAKDWANLIVKSYRRKMYIRTVYSTTIRRHYG